MLGLGDELEIDEDKGNKILAEAYPEVLKLLNSPDIDDIERTCVEFVTGAYKYFGLGGIKKDYQKAFETIKKCADKGHVAAIYDLGANFYYNGNGTEKNDKLAEYYLNIAKNAGLKRAIKLYNERDYEE